MTTIPLGFEISTGTPVEVPLRHLVITGQTQEAGKTTALEALIARSGLRAVTFVTKRGEGSFRAAHRIDPYFREQADWQFVASILEASRGEKMKFERAWIIRASKGAHSLADVQRNVRAALEKAKGLSADVYLTLDAYLDAVVPQIGRVRWAPKVELSAGVNVMDLAALNVEMQHLVIRSTIDWVLAHETETVVVVPEAWKFVPQGRGTPVKLAAEAYIRQAAGLRNYLWLDSQDIAGVEKVILKSVPVWILGVQRESNEVKRTLAQIPAGIKKPRAEDVATLGLGQFYVCHGTSVRKVYVQPAWMSSSTAARIARDEEAPPKPPATPRPEPESELDMADLHRLEDKIDNLAEFVRRGLAASQAVEEVVSALPRGKAEVHPLPIPAEPPADRREEALYQLFKCRLMEEVPALLQVLAEGPEIRVTIERRVIEATGESLRGRLALLIHEGFFDSGATGHTVNKELARRGGMAPVGSLYGELDELARLGFLTIEPAKSKKDGKKYVAVTELKKSITTK